ncbi:MAG: hypothetical protein K2X69_09245 [Silvanigrellaceae bacterium]|nr:hypothetical protein [Silvanigrellaceae bacterium]
MNRYELIANELKEFDKNHMDSRSKIFIRDQIIIMLCNTIETISKEYKKKYDKNCVISNDFIDDFNNNQRNKAV